MKIALLFPGYSSQFVGMGKELYDESRIVQEYFEQAANCLDVNFVKLCFASSDVELAKMEHTYTALFLISSAFFAVLKEAGIEPDVVAGYNTGQYAALFAAQGITLPDGLYFLNKYALFYREFLTTIKAGFMQVDGLESADLEQICNKESSREEQASIAIYATQQNCIVTGHSDVVDRVRDRVLKYENVQVDTVDPAVGIHSALMKPVADQVAGYLPKIDLKELQIPLINDIDARLITSSQDVTDIVINQITSPVRWDKVMDSLIAYDIFIEVAPASFLTKLLKRRYPDKTALTINNKSDIDKLKKLLHDFSERGKD